MGIFDRLLNRSVEEMKWAGDVNGLIKALGSRADWQERKAAARALLEMRDARAIEPLVKALGDENEEVRETSAATVGVVVALGRLEASGGDVSLLRMLPGMLQPQGTRPRTPDKVPVNEVQYKRAVTLLTQALRADSEPVRRGAAIALGIIGDDDAVYALKRALDDQSAGVREEATVALERITRNRTTELDEDEKERIAKLGGTLMVMPSREAVLVLRALAQTRLGAALVQERAGK